jgi:hypothetical protein
MQESHMDEGTFKYTKVAGDIFNVYTDILAGKGKFEYVGQIRRGYRGNELLWSAYTPLAGEVRRTILGYAKTRKDASKFFV